MAKVSYPKTRQERAKLYVHCMLEIKERLTAVNFLLDSPMPALFKQETAYLQLRHICEVIAIACLAGQGDFKTQRAFTEEYSPPKIFNALRESYPAFFPQPCEIRSENGEHHLTANAKPGAYDEAAVTALWNRSSDHLHRASVKKYLSRAFGPPLPLDDIKKHVGGLILLLESHVVSIQAGQQKTLLQVNLEDGSGGMEAHFLNIDMENATIAVETFRGSVTRR
ncbi:MAG TPA: hypothetical protein VHM92_09345 [Allosphingosinicella sp.]|nr:hypothetical protein [Allosphingosinicella sp.]